MFVSGRKDLPAPNVATRLVPQGSQPANRITNISLQAPSTNAGSVFVGGSDVVSSPAAATTGIELTAGATESFSCSDAADVWVAATSAADAVRYRAKSL